MKKQSKLSRDMQRGLSRNVSVPPVMGQNAYEWLNQGP